MLRDQEPREVMDQGVNATLCTEAAMGSLARLEAFEMWAKIDGLIDSKTYVKMYVYRKPVVISNARSYTPLSLSISDFKPCWMLRFCFPIIGISNAPETDTKGHKTRCECDPIRHSVTCKSFRTSPPPVMDIGIVVVNATVEQIKYVAEYNRGESHGAPILRQTIDPKRFGYKRWIYTK